MFWPTMIRRPRCGTGTVAEAIHRSRPWPWSVTRGKAADPELISSPGHQGSHPALIPCRPAGRINREDPAYGEEMGPYRVPDPPRKPFPPRRGASACTWLSRFPLATSRRPPPASADRNLQETEGSRMGKREPILPSGYWGDDRPLIPLPRGKSHLLWLRLASFHHRGSFYPR